MHFVIHVVSGTQIVLGYLTMLMASWAVLYFLLRPLVYVGEFCKAKPGQAFFTGLLTVAFVSAGTFLLAVSPFAFVLPLWYVFLGASVFYGFLAIALVVGESCLKSISYTEHPFGEMFCGCSVLFLLMMVPYIGLALVSIVWLIGLGAVIKLKGGIR